ncbi:hypothetical protein CALCODRAFT_501786 [Calocera cornea HHB12733]|uniref:GRF-type domain-containing protein n=1 Tax=Calocera cornea HHB12733 TaxID=1353952 RepID=A0A165DIF1_9BASI|nr:hypothetical protein CALCODRAFT_501786 [Calocera cornea HHB12733]
MAMTPPSPLVKLEPQDDGEFNWPVPVDDHRPSCWCCDPEPSALYQANTKRNKGRWFYTCSRSRDYQCNFFMWADQVIGKAHPARPLPATADMNTHMIGFSNHRPAHNHIARTPPRTPERSFRAATHTPGAWPAQEEEEFFSTQGSPMARPMQLDWPASRMPAPQDPRTPRTPARALVNEPRTPANLNLSTSSKDPPPTPSYITPATAEQLRFLSTLSAQVHPSYADELTTLAEHLKRQDRLLKAADKTIYFRDRKIVDLLSELEACKQHIVELEHQQSGADTSDVQGLAMQSAVHEARIAELEAAVANLMGHRG